MTEYQIPIEIGKSILELQDFGVIRNKNLTFPLRIITVSPIIIRIPLNKFEEQSENLVRYTKGMAVSVYDYDYSPPEPVAAPPL